MRFLKNRTVLGVLCIVLSLIICFAVTPLFNKAMSEKTEIVRVVKPISVGEEITSDMVKTIEVGSYNLPDDVVKHSDTVVGAFASADLAARRLHPDIQDCRRASGRKCLSLSSDRRKAGNLCYG